MNDAQWLRHWCAQNVKAAAGDVEANAKELARKAEAAAARDGFSVDDALRAEGHASLSGYILGVLRERQGETRSAKS
jgi:hypothetical protein